MGQQETLGKTAVTPNSELTLLTMILKSKKTQSTLARYRYNFVCFRFLCITTHKICMPLLTSWGEQEAASL